MNDSSTEIVKAGFPVQIARNESERIALSQRLNDALMEKYDPLEGYVVLKNAESIIKVSIEIAKEAAIMKMESKEETVLGVKVAQRRSIEYEYDHPRLGKIEEEMKKLKDEEKALKMVLQSIKEPMIYESTGEYIAPAKKVRDGLTIAVTLPK